VYRHPLPISNLQTAVEREKSCAGSKIEIGDKKKRIIAVIDGTRTAFFEPSCYKLITQATGCTDRSLDHQTTLLVGMAL
jgi:hypothetical protein